MTRDRAPDADFTEPSPLDAEPETIAGLGLLAGQLGRSGPVDRLGHGMDFVTYTCDDLVLRVPQRAEVAALVDAEYRLLCSLPTDLPLAVPRPVAPPIVPPGGHFPVLAYPHVAGTPWCRLRAVDPIRLGHAVGPFLRALHAAPIHEVAPGIDLDAWTGAAADALADCAVGLTGATGLDGLVAWVDEVLTAATPPVGAERVMCHRDLTDDHVLIDVATGRPVGVIDFGDAGASPWWHDLVGLWMWAGEAALEAACAGYGRQLGGEERILLERHGVAVAAWDLTNAIDGRLPAGVDEAAATLRRVLNLACRRR